MHAPLLKAPNFTVVVKLGIGGFSMGVATALYSATCFAQGKYGNGIDYPINLRAIVGLSGWLPGSREAQEKKLEGIKKQQEIHNRLAVEHKIFLRDRKIKFFERRKIERRIGHLEKMQRASSGQSKEAEIAEQLSKLKEDLEYVRFFPKTEKYVSLFMGGDDTQADQSQHYCCCC
ncbi:rRNA-processing protein efg1 [Camellia lanceoleosa]|uniref:rRNA-processing protein efg1 n=1 Tax=Camellia lanceoleosa TaxID=1840588 RepID=A0ACC0GEH9_9ERIC|nr:rRNA-processing protein efg1 [Camellia lanceoleosa]